MAQSKIAPGERVKVINSESPEAGRTAKVIGEAPGKDGRRWVVAFEYPLGGITGRAELPEADLQVVPLL